MTCNVLIYQCNVSGFIGKGVSRHLNRCYNYAGLGACGTLFYVLVFPPLCLLVSLSAFAIALLAPLWLG